MDPIIHPPIPGTGVTRQTECRATVNATGCLLISDESLVLGLEHVSDRECLQSLLDKNTANGFPSTRRAGLL